MTATITPSLDTPTRPLAYVVLDSPVSHVLVAGTDAGISAVLLGDDAEALEADLTRANPDSFVRRGEGPVARWARVILAFLRGETTRLDLRVDVEGTAFQHRVWDILRAIPYGATRSYAEVARALGAPAAARAVALACATNPAALVIPCHRVVRGDGDLGGYRWGVARKAALLERERAVARAGERRVLSALVARAPRAEHPPAPDGVPVAGRYQLERFLGAGSAGAVYRARDRELDETVAVKVLASDRITHDGETLRRFRQEIRLARRVSHPHVVRTYDLGEAGGCWFLTMEYVDGIALGDVLRHWRRLPPAAVVVLGMQLCRALAAVHAQGILHGDLKPQNVLLTPEGDAKLADFGVAALLEGEAARAGGNHAAGTLWYMAPEQLLGEAIDARADLFALGALLYECLTGRPPFAGATPEAQLARILSETPVPPHLVNPEVPPELSALLLATVSPEPNKRPASATELHDALYHSAAPALPVGE